MALRVSQTRVINEENFEVTTFYIPAVLTRSKGVPDGATERRKHIKMGGYLSYASYGVINVL